MVTEANRFGRQYLGNVIMRDPTARIAIDRAHSHEKKGNRKNHERSKEVPPKIAGLNPVPPTEIPVTLELPESPVSPQPEFMIFSTPETTESERVESPRKFGKTNSLKERLSKLGYEMSQEELDRAFRGFRIGAIQRQLENLKSLRKMKLMDKKEFVQKREPLVTKLKLLLGQKTKQKETVVFSQ